MAASIVASEQMWRRTLLDGHRPLRLTRRVARHLPHAPRCKLCHNPFAGLGGWLVGFAGFRPSRKNPAFCARCCEALPEGGAEIDIAVVFADVRGSTELGEGLAACEFAELLNRFYRTATDVLVSHDAVIDKFVGDEVMALFIPGMAGPGYRRRAGEAAVALLEAVGYGSRDGAWLPIGAAAHAGTAFVGNVGGNGIIDFTALGDTVNTTARLQSHAAAGQVVLSEDVYQRVAERVPHADARTLSVRGRTKPITIRVVAI